MIAVANNSTCDYWIRYRYGTTPCCATITATTGYILVSGGTTYSFTPPAGEAPCIMVVAYDSGGVPGAIFNNWNCSVPTGVVYTEVANCASDTDAVENNGWSVKIDTL